MTWDIWRQLWYCCVLQTAYLSEWCRDKWLSGERWWLSYLNVTRFKNTTLHWFTDLNYFLLFYFSFFLISHNMHFILNNVFCRYTECNPTSRAYLKYAKWEEKQFSFSEARGTYTYKHVLIKISLQQESKAFVINYFKAISFFLSYFLRISTFSFAICYLPSLLPSIHPFLLTY